MTKPPRTTTDQRTHDEAPPADLCPLELEPARSAFLDAAEELDAARSELWEALELTHTNPMHVENVDRLTAARGARHPAAVRYDRAEAAFATRRVELREAARGAVPSMRALILERYDRSADDIRDRIHQLADEVEELGALPVWRSTVLDNLDALAAGRRGLGGLFAPYVNHRRIRYPLPTAGGAKAADLEELVGRLRALGDYLAASAVEPPDQLGPQKPAKPSKVPTPQPDPVAAPS